MTVMKEDKKKIAIVGCGLIGASLAVLFTGNSFPVTILGRSDDSLNRGLALYRGFFQGMVDAGVLQEKNIWPCEALLTRTASYDKLADADLVIEAVVENLAVKHDVYQKIERVCRPDAVIASVSSAITADDLSSGMQHPERLLVAHPWNPPHLVPCVEIARGQKTSDASVQAAVDIFGQAGREVVVLHKSVPGFIGNRLMHAMFREATYMVEAGIATPEDIDRVLMTSFGPRYSSIGIFEHNDFVGLDMVDSISTYLYPSLCDSKAPMPKLRALDAQGKIGYKSGTGYLDWRKKDMTDFRERQSRPYLGSLHWDLPGSK